jgi:hypothetical protein
MLPRSLLGWSLGFVTLMAVLGWFAYSALQ